MKMKTVILPATLLFLGFTSCKKESTAETSASFRYRLQATNPASVIARTATNLRTESVNVTWTAGKAMANELKFEAENSKGEVAFKQKTAQQIDLFASNSTLGSIALPAGSYSEVEFKAVLAPANASPALELSGSFTTNGITRTIQFIVSAPVELKAEKKNVTVAQGAAYSAVNSLDLSQLTNGVSEAALGSATVTNGVIILSASSNTGLYNTLLKNLGNHHGEAEVEHEHD